MCLVIRLVSNYQNQTSRTVRDSLTVKKRHLAILGVQFLAIFGIKIQSTFHKNDLSVAASQ